MVVHGDGLFYAQPVDAVTGPAVYNHYLRHGWWAFCPTIENLSRAQRRQHPLTSPSTYSPTSLFK